MQKLIGRIVLLFALSSAHAANCQTFDQGAAQNVVVGDVVKLSLSGLKPGEIVEIKAERTLGFPRDGRQTSLQTFVADADGRVSLSESAPVVAGYSGSDPSGPFWSMAPAYPFTAGAKANEYNFTAFVDAKPVARTKVMLIDDNGGLAEEPIAGFEGAFLVRPSGRADLPVIVVLGGSEGGDYFARLVARRLAAKGFAVLGLPYYSPLSVYRPLPQFPTLPSRFEKLPIDRLRAVYAWIRAKPGLDATRIGLYGQSRGAEFALIAATRFPWIKSVAAIVPTDVVVQGWGGEPGQPQPSFSFNGSQLPFVPAPSLPLVLRRLEAGLPTSLRGAYDEGRRAYPSAVRAARIPVEQFRGQLLVAGGIDDSVWSSAVAAQAIAETRAARGLETELLVFESAGHNLTGSGWEPFDESPGGTRAGNAFAQKATWLATISFFQRSLLPSRIQHRPSQAFEG